MFDMSDLNVKYIYRGLWKRCTVLPKQVHFLGSKYILREACTSLIEVHSASEWPRTWIVLTTSSTEGTKGESNLHADLCLIAQKCLPTALTAPLPKTREGALRAAADTDVAYDSCSSVALLLSPPSAVMSECLFVTAEGSS